MDLERHLIAAEAATAAQMNPHIPELTDQIAAAPIGGLSVLVLWAGLACDKTATLEVGPAGDTVTISPDTTEDCDLVPSYRGVVLSFAQPRPAESLRLVLNPTEVIEP